MKKVSDSVQCDICIAINFIAIYVYLQKANGLCKELVRKLYVPHCIKPVHSVNTPLLMHTQDCN
jgi:hypothetical protein